MKQHHISCRLQNWSYLFLSAEGLWLFWGAGFWWTIYPSVYSQTMRTWAWHSPTSNPWTSSPASGMVINGQLREARLRSTGHMHPLWPPTRTINWTRALQLTHTPHVLCLLSSTGGIKSSTKHSRPRNKTSCDGWRKITWCTTTVRMWSATRSSRTSAPKTRGDSSALGTSTEPFREFIKHLNTDWGLE